MMKTVLRIIPLLGLAILAYLYWGEEGIAHLIFPSVPDEISLSPSKLAAGLSFEQSLLLLFGTILLSLIIFLIFKNTILPKISATILNWLTGQDSCYAPEDDELVQIMEQVGPSPSRGDLSPLDAYCQKHPKRLRGWTEYAKLLRTQIHDTEAAIDVLNRAHQAVASDEDKALILYRIAGIYENELGRPDKAKDVYAELIDKYPLCSYGKMALKKR